MIPQTEQSERRIGTRIPSNQPVCFCDTAGSASLCGGSLLTKSFGAMSIRTDTPQTVGTRIDIEFPPTDENGQEETLLSKGEIRYVEKFGAHGYVLGIKTLYNPKQTRIETKKTAHYLPKVALKGIRFKPIPVKSVQQSNAIPKQKRSKPNTGRKSFPIWKPVLLVILFLIIFFLLLLGSRQSQAKNADSLRGISYAQSASGASEKAPASHDYASGTFTYNHLDTSIDTKKLQAVPPYFQKPQDSFLSASLGTLRPIVHDPGSQDVPRILNALPAGNSGNPSPVEKLARDLENAQTSMLAGNRLAALYRTRNAADSVNDLPELWREVLRNFRGRLIIHPNEIPVLPKLDNWVTLDSSLTSLPIDAPIVVYVDKDTFVLHVVKNAATIWQFPVGLGAKGSTPDGIFTIGAKIREPDWYNSGDVVPAGVPNNPLGDRWLGLSDGNTPLTYGMHPTNKSQSIGQALSKGCIRMRPQDARRLYNMVPLGTPIVVRSGSMSPKL